MGDFEFLSPCAIHNLNIDAECAVGSWRQAGYDDLLLAC